MIALLILCIILAIIPGWVLAFRQQQRAERWKRMAEIERGRRRNYERDIGKDADIVCDIQGETCRLWRRVNG